MIGYIVGFDALGWALVALAIIEVPPVSPTAGSGNGNLLLKPEGQ